MTTDQKIAALAKAAANLGLSRLHLGCLKASDFATPTRKRTFFYIVDDDFTAIDDYEIDADDGVLISWQSRRRPVTDAEIAVARANPLSCIPT